MKYDKKANKQALIFFIVDLKKWKQLFLNDRYALGTCLFCFVYFNRFHVVDLFRQYKMFEGISISIHITLKLNFWAVNFVWLMFLVLTNSE